jgi:hypothetical protein
MQASSAGFRGNARDTGVRRVDMGLATGEESSGKEAQRGGE